MPAKAKSNTAILFRQLTNRVTVNPVMAKSKWWQEQRIEMEIESIQQRYFHFLLDTATEKEDKIDKMQYFFPFG